MTSVEIWREFERAKREGRPVEYLAELRERYEAAVLAEATDDGERHRVAEQLRTARDIDDVFARTDRVTMRDRAVVRRSCASCQRRQVLLLFRDRGRWVLWTASPRGAAGRGGALRFVAEGEDTAVMAWCRCGRHVVDVAEVFAWRDNGPRFAALDSSRLAPANDTQISLKRARVENGERRDGPLS